MKQLKWSMPLVLLVTMTFSGCSWCEKVVEVEVDRPVYIDVPVRCTIPDVNCSWSGIPTHEVPVKLMECIVELKRASEVCQ